MYLDITDIICIYFLYNERQNEENKFEQNHSYQIKLFKYPDMEIKNEKRKVHIRLKQKEFFIWFL